LEFKRILRPGGLVALIWNERKDSPFNRDYEAMLERFAPEYRDVRERDRAGEARLRAFFAPSVPTLTTFGNEQRLDEPGLVGRLMSSSYAPRVGDPRNQPMLNELASIFRAHARGGEIVIEYETLLWCGPLA
jgi:hypothetical protein